MWANGAADRLLQWQRRGGVVDSIAEMFGSSSSSSSSATTSVNTPCTGGGGGGSGDCGMVDKRNKEPVNTTNLCLMRVTRGWLRRIKRQVLVAGCAGGVWSVCVGVGRTGCMDGNEVGQEAAVLGKRLREIPHIVLMVAYFMQREFDDYTRDEKGKEMVETQANWWSIFHAWMRGFRKQVRREREFMWWQTLDELVNAVLPVFVDVPPVLLRELVGTDNQQQHQHLPMAGMSATDLFVGGTTLLGVLRCGGGYVALAVYLYCTVLGGTAPIPPCVSTLTADEHVSISDDDNDDDDEDGGGDTYSHVDWWWFRVRHDALAHILHQAGAGLCRMAQRGESEGLTCPGWRQRMARQSRRERDLIFKSPEQRRADHVRTLKDDADELSDAKERESDQMLNLRSAWSIIAMMPEGSTLLNYVRNCNRLVKPEHHFDLDDTSHCFEPCRGTFVRTIQCLPPSAMPTPTPTDTDADTTMVKPLSTPTGGSGDHTRSPSPFGMSSQMTTPSFTNDYHQQHSTEASVGRKRSLSLQRSVSVPLSPLVDYYSHEGTAGKHRRFEWTTADEPTVATATATTTTVSPNPAAVPSLTPTPTPTFAPVPNDADAIISLEDLPMPDGPIITLETDPRSVRNALYSSKYNFML